jgi:hypothetical protein
VSGTNVDIRIENQSILIPYQVDGLCLGEVAALDDHSEVASDLMGC